MKFIIDKWIFNGTEHYHIEPENIFSEQYTAKYLGLTLEEYQNILKSFNAYQPINYIHYYFNTIEDAEKAIEKLTPILVMANLTN